jgi:hypothetical protein
MLQDYLKLKLEYNDKPIDSFIQVIMIVLYCWNYDHFISIEIVQADYFCGCICSDYIDFGDIILAL